MKKQDEPFFAKDKTAKFDKDVEEILSAALAKDKYRKRLIKRLSPFLLLAVFLTLWFSYTIVMGNETIQNRGILLVLFVITLVNILFIDFALWKYFEHKKVLIIWLIEIIFSLPIIYFLI